MSWTLAQVKSRVRALTDSNNVGTWCDDDFVTPLINQIYTDACQQLISTQSQWDIGIVELPGVTPGTPNLMQAQQAGALSTLIDMPERIDWKPSGADESYYMLVRNYEVLPDVQPQLFVQGWEYRSDIIWLTRFSINVDLRIRGEFQPAALTKDSDILTAHPNIGYPVAYGTAALIGVVRGNDKWATTFQEQALKGLDDIMMQLTRAEQGHTRRVKRMPRRNRGFGFISSAI